MKKFLVTCLLGLFLMTGVVWPSQQAMSPGLIKWLLRNVGSWAVNQVLDWASSGGGGGATSDSGGWTRIRLRCNAPGGWEGTRTVCADGTEPTCHATECIATYPLRVYSGGPEEE